MTDWGRVPKGAGEALQEIGDAAVIGGWLKADDERVFAEIVTRVGAASTDTLDRLDAALLSLAATSGDPDVRLRLIKFYAVLKVAEMERYREFRGFPQ